MIRRTLALLFAVLLSAVLARTRHDLVHVVHHIGGPCAQQLCFGLVLLQRLPPERYRRHLTQLPLVQRPGEQVVLLQGPLRAVSTAPPLSCHSTVQPPEVPSLAGATRVTVAPKVVSGATPKASAYDSMYWPSVGLSMYEGRPAGKSRSGDCMTTVGKFVCKFLYTTLFVGSSAHTPPNELPFSKRRGRWPARRRSPACPPCARRRSRPPPRRRWPT